MLSSPPCSTFMTSLPQAQRESPSPPPAIEAPKPTTVQQKQQGERTGVLLEGDEIITSDSGARETSSTTAAAAAAVKTKGGIKTHVGKISDKENKNTAVSIKPATSRSNDNGGIEDSAVEGKNSTSALATIREGTALDLSPGLRQGTQAESGVTTSDEMTGTVRGASNVRVKTEQSIPKLTKNRGGEEASESNGREEFIKSSSADAGTLRASATAAAAPGEEMASPDNQSNVERDAVSRGSNCSGGLDARKVTAGVLDEENDTLGASSKKRPLSAAEGEGRGRGSNAAVEGGDGAIDWEEKQDHPPKKR